MATKLQVFVLVLVTGNAPLVQASLMQITCNVTHTTLCLKKRDPDVINCNFEKD